MRELLSALKFPLTGKNTGNFLNMSRYGRSKRLYIAAYQMVAVLSVDI